jgi:hypothetical protein
MTMAVVEVDMSTREKPATADLSNRQVTLLAVIGIVALVVAVLAIALYSDPAIVPAFIPASTSAADLTAAAFAMLI